MALTTVQQGLIDTQTSIPMTYGAIGTGNASTLKNRIINGAMVIDQRNAGANSVAINTYTVDRWGYQATQSNKGTWGQNFSGATPPAGFASYLGFQTGGSAFSVGAGDYFSFFQPIEGFNTADLGWGTANAKTVTLSFQVLSSLTGTFGGVLQNSASTRCYPFTYTVSSANTWTQISVTIAGETTGTWLTTNGVGVRVLFNLGCGSTYSGAAGAWSSNNYVAPTGTVSVVGTASATFYITGVQLEVGSSATGFEYRQYTTELQLCQRYYQQVTTGVAGRLVSGAGVWGSGSFIICPSPLKVSMRTSPTLISNTGTNYWVTSAPLNVAFNALGLVMGESTAEMSGFYSTSISGGTTGQALYVIASNAAALLAYSSEL